MKPWRKSLRIVPSSLLVMLLAGASWPTLAAEVPPPGVDLPPEYEDPADDPPLEPDVDAAAQAACTDIALINPSFEEPYVTGAWQRYSSIPGWTGEIDIHTSSDLPVAQGRQIADLNQIGIGEPLNQSVTLVPGAAYVLRFHHGINYHCATRAEFAVQVGGASRRYESTSTLAEESLYFIARTADTQIRFSSLTPGCGAATIDNVRLECSSEPQLWPNSASRANSDAWLTNHHEAIRLMRPSVLVLNFSNKLEALTPARTTINALAEGSKYHGYGPSSAPAFLRYRLRRVVNLIDRDDFATRERWVTGSGAFADEQKWLTGDFDNDGRTDWAMISHAGGNIDFTVYLSRPPDSSRPGWTFERQSWPIINEIPFPGGRRWYSGDFDGDGDDDLAHVFSQGGLATIDVYRSEAGGFRRVRAATQLGTIESGPAWFAGDFDGDGRSDIAKAFADTDAGGRLAIVVYRSSGPASSMVFTKKRWASPNEPFVEGQRWIAGRFSGDDTADIARIYDENGDASIAVYEANASSSSFTRKAGGTRQGVLSAEQIWFSGDFNGDKLSDLAKSFGAGGLGAVDVHRNLGAGSSPRFRRHTWELPGGAFWPEQHWGAGDFDGDGVTEVSLVFAEGGNVSIDVLLQRSTSALAPRRADGTFDYAALFSQPYADRYGFFDSSLGRNLTLCELINQGELHEVWFQFDIGSPKGFEALEYKQRYDERGNAIAGSFERHAGNEDIPDLDLPAFQACGRSVRIMAIDANRRPGCALHSLGHAFESTGGRQRAGIIPLLQKDFLRFANFDLDTRHGMPFPHWYEGCRYSEPKMQTFATSCPGTPSATDSSGRPSCVTITGSTSRDWRRYYNDSGGLISSGSIADHSQGCGSVHFPPNARDDYDYGYACSVSSSCENFGFRNGAGGADALDSYDEEKADRYEFMASDCGGGWQIYWRQNFPGLLNPATSSDGYPMPNWWVYLFY